MHRIASLALVAACTGAISPPPPPVDSSIRCADLLNRAYVSSLGDTGETFTVVGGSWVDPSTPFGERPPFFDVRAPVYGDVDGDGAEDAVVITREGGGGTGVFDDARVLALRGGDVVELARIPGGDRRDGGLHAVAVEPGGVRVERYDSDGHGACCATRLAIEHWRWTGRELELDEPSTSTVELDD